MIRPAGLGESAEIVSLLRAFHGESGWNRWFGWDRRSVASFVRQLMAEHVLLVAEIDGRIVGTAAAVLHASPFNEGVTVAQEMFWYVAPAHRKGLGGDLMAALERSCRERGADLFVMACIQGKRDASLSRVYRAAGFVPSECTFIKRI